MIGSRPAPRRWSWFAVGLVLPLAGVFLMLASEPNASKVPSRAELAAQTALEPIPLALPSTRPLPAPEAQPSAVEPAAATLTLTVKSGDSLDTLFRRSRLSPTDLANMAALEDAGRFLKLLRPGDEIHVAHRDGRIESLSRELDEIKMLAIRRNDTGFEAAIVERDVEIRTVGAHGVIETSLFEAGMAAGISDSVTMEMAGVFQWDIDFIQDVRVGDEFTVVYQELWRDGSKLRNGSIVAAEFINQGQSFRAARYVDGSGRADYYTPQGRSVRKAFLRAPVQFTRISSNFDLKRRHPILNTIRAHRGVDYAAPTGTPIQAAGDGKVIFRGSKNGYGNAVIVQHGMNITTLYGHMSRFAKQRVGNRVRQGEVIGYVGSSGLATGPHLHYEYRVSGVHRNPRTVQLPPADPVPAEYREDFEITTASLWHQLDLYQRTRLAAVTE